ncbi:hypothetical protein VTK56DRAFT_318 [Thermocarpiscus australiensis]
MPLPVCCRYIGHLADAGSKLNVTCRLTEPRLRQGELNRDGSETRCPEFGTSVFHRPTVLGAPYCFGSSRPLSMAVSMVVSRGVRGTGLTYCPLMAGSFLSTYYRAFKEV